MLRALPIALLTALLAASGCGQAGGGKKSFSGEARKVASVVDNLQQAARDRDTRRICRYLLDPALARRLGNCDRAMIDVLDHSDALDLAVQDVRLLGADRARARVRTGTDGKDDRVIDLVRAGGDWRIADTGSRVSG